MPFFIYAWLAAFLYGLVTIIGKLTAKYSINNPWLFNFLWTLISLIFTSMLALINNTGLPHDWMNITIAAVFYSLFNIFYIFSLSRLDVSVLVPLLNLRMVMALIFSFLILKEGISMNQIGLIILMLVAGIFVSIDEKYSIKSFFQSSTALMILAVASIALNSIFINKAMSTNGYWEVTLWTGIISQVLLIFTLPFFRQDISKLSIGNIGSVSLMALSLTLATITSNFAYAKNVSISNAIISLPLSMIMVFIISFFAPHLLEKHTLKVYAIRFSSAAVMIVSALLLTR